MDETLVLGGSGTKQVASGSDVTWSLVHLDFRRDSVFRINLSFDSNFVS